ncbi:hypothetical protein O181_035287 [Austropuccinia psidii MF-1]|uniref:Uncharacterized protein n=1 Tax=Austropuccinia psidii MF-1 TaxID=1389203 RepID=A0A9Q3D8C4_9BASI|nr:hypothetical protein [Austropuccinia psidii MF-1]
MLYWHQKCSLPPFMCIPGALAFSIYVDWFNAHGESSRLASIGPIMLMCLNFPPSERLKPENVYVSAIIPGPKEPTALQLNCLLMSLIKELKELGQGYHFSPTSTGPSGSFIRVASTWPLWIWSPCASLLDLLIQETTFAIFALFTKLKLKKLVLNFTTCAHIKIINQPLPNGFGKPHNKEKRFSLSMECNIQFGKAFRIGMQPE